MTKRFFSPRFLITSVLKSFFRLVFIAGVLQGCNDDPYQIGLNLLPSEDLIELGQDSLTVETYTAGPVGIPVYDSLNLPFGSYNDPVFGQTRAALMLQLSPYSSYIRINPGLVVDSVIMNILYDKITVGDTLYVPEIEVFQLTEGIGKNTRYLSDYDVTGKYNTDNLNPNGTIIPDTTLRYKFLLSNELGTDLLTTEGMNDSILFSSYKIDSVFDANFKGLYLRPLSESETGAIITFYDIRLTVNFHTDIDTNAISFIYLPDDLRIDSSRTWIGDKVIKIFDHDYSGTPVTHLNDSTFQDTAIYLQSLGGTQAVLNIQSVDQLRQMIGKVSVSEAELLIPVLDTAEFYDYYPPFQLGIRVLDEANAFVPDDILYQSTQSSVPLNFINGRLDKSVWSYKFFLTSYFQELMKGNVNSGKFQIFAGRADINTGRSNYNPDVYNRLILCGSGNPNHKITFKITYIKLPELNKK